MAQFSQRTVKQIEEITMKLNWLYWLPWFILLIARPAIANVHRIEIKTGQATILREGTSKFVPVANHNKFNLGDILLPAQGAKVFVRCAKGYGSG